MTGGHWLRIGAVLGFLAVAAGAFGAHGLKGRYEALQKAGSLTEAEVKKRLDVFETAARYQMYHALALLALGLVRLHASASATAGTIAGWSFLVGVLLFSGSLYAMGLTGIRWLGAITPFGGVGFLIGWIALAIAIGSSGTAARGVG